MNLSVMRRLVLSVGSIGMKMLVGWSLSVVVVCMVGLFYGMMFKVLFMSFVMYVSMIGFILSCR